MGLSRASMSIMVSTHFPADVPHQSSDYYHEHLKCKNGSEALPGKLCVGGGVMEGTCMKIDEVAETPH